MTTPLKRRPPHLWHHHPAVRTGPALTAGERAADTMRNSMGSWGFVFGSLSFLGVWIAAAENNIPIDNPQLTILNLVLSCLAALQGAILLIAAKRSDQIASELARHDYDTNTAALALVREIRAEQAEMRAELAQLRAAGTTAGGGTE